MIEQAHAGEPACAAPEKDRTRNFDGARYVVFATDERVTTTMGLTAGAFTAIRGVPGKVLADRMGCLKGGVVANVVVPAALI